jgi:hypothetical protein
MRTCQTCSIRHNLTSSSAHSQDIPHAMIYVPKEISILSIPLSTVALRCWHEYGRDYVPNFYSRPSWEHIELPALIRQARDLETAQRILKSNLNACLHNRELRRRDMDELLYPIRNRNGDYPHGFDEPRSIRWLRRELDRK